MGQAKLITEKMFEIQTLPCDLTVAIVHACAQPPAINTIDPESES